MIVTRRRSSVPSQLLAEAALRVVLQWINAPAKEAARLFHEARIMEHGLATMRRSALETQTLWQNTYEARLCLAIFSDDYFAASAKWGQAKRTANERLWYLQVHDCLFCTFNAMPYRRALVRHVISHQKIYLDACPYPHPLS